MASNRGLLHFIIIAAGQLVSLVGTAMAGLALSIWAWQETGQATTLALLSLFGLIPAIFLSPFIGVFVDRWNRKLTMMLSDLAAGLSTVITLVLLATGQLEIWHLYLLAVWAGLFSAFQIPAYTATIGAMVPEKHYGRASGILSLAQSSANLIAPALAGILLTVTSIEAILWIDVVTFAVAVLTLLFVSVPSPSSQHDDQRTLWQSARDGFGFIAHEPTLRALVLLYVVINLIGAIGMVMLAPTTLARSNNDALALGSVMSALGLGGLTGGAVMSVWGGPRRRIHGVLLGLAAVGIFGYSVFGIGRTPLIWLVGAFNISFFVPILSGSNQAIWLSQIPKELQGRVLATRQMIGLGVSPLVMLGVGPLADYVVEPAMQSATWYAAVFTPLVGNGVGAGMASLFLIAGLLAFMVALYSYFIPSIRQADKNTSKSPNTLEQPNSSMSDA